MLWVRQTPDALLRVDTFGSGLAQVVASAFPTLLHVLLARRPSVVLVEGLGIVVLLVAIW